MQLVVLCIFAICHGISWQLALFSLIPAIVIVGSLIYQRLISPFYKRIRHSVGELVAQLENNLSGIAVIKSFTTERFEMEQVKAASNDYKTANIPPFAGLSITYLSLRMVLLALLEYGCWAAIGY